ncbi:hypothetical protein TBR22_A02090 [Luteitalea sp. TBR-22]|uniref:YybH family protein n=1 Tax=Luteitalea sp. TBR-22 TaxID=2802971 RepID=UPI001AF32E5C|nr:SgcJ/EcaC family oxidoreductase [Luteitalea sp. TBR-22]BCS31010.1 hypothetical protein TBR22_A02090 [Luteitalea sp. TBR-22]
MRHLLAGLVLSLIIVVPANRVGAAQAPSADQVAAVKAVVARYVAVREARDAAGLAALLMEDADQLVSTGEWRRGREAVVTGGLASSARSGGVRTIEVESVRFPTLDVAIVDGRYEIAATASTPARRMWTTFVMVRGAVGWRISAIRNMRPSE